MEGSKLKSKIESSFLKLKSYCESENFKGWDPYDGLNSKVFKALPFKYWDLGRAIWIQIFKHSPINFRRFYWFQKNIMLKDVALFLLGYCKLYKLAKSG